MTWRRGESKHEGVLCLRKLLILCAALTASDAENAQSCDHAATAIAAAVSVSLFRKHRAGSAASPVSAFREGSCRPA